MLGRLASVTFLAIAHLAWGVRQVERYGVPPSALAVNLNKVLASGAEHEPNDLMRLLWMATPWSHQGVDHGAHLTGTSVYSDTTVPVAVRGGPGNEFGKRVAEYFGHTTDDEDKVFYFAFQGVRSDAELTGLTQPGAFVAARQNQAGLVHPFALALFNKKLRKLEDVFHQVVKKGDHVRLYFLGHGLGGCIAAIAADHFLNAKGTKDVLTNVQFGVLTFGSPAYGDDTFLGHLQGQASVLNLINARAYGATADLRLDPIPGRIADDINKFLVKKDSGATIEDATTANEAPLHHVPKMVPPETVLVVDGFECLHSVDAYAATITESEKFPDETHKKCAVVVPGLELHGGRTMEITAMNQKVQRGGEEMHDFNRLFFMTYFQVTKVMAAYSPNDALKFTEPHVVWANTAENHEQLSSDDKSAVLPMSVEDTAIAPHFIMLEGEVPHTEFSRRVFLTMGHPEEEWSDDMHTVYFAFKGMRIRELGKEVNKLVQEFQRLVQRSSLSSNKNVPGSTHTGAGEIFAAIKTRFVELLDEKVMPRANDHKPVHVVFVGYSFGGATAQISAAFFNEYVSQFAPMVRGYIWASVLTFGCPRVGDEEFNKYLWRGTSLNHIVTLAKYKAEGPKFEPVPFWPRETPPNAGLLAKITKDDAQTTGRFEKVKDPAVVGELDVASSRFTEMRVFLSKIVEDTVGKIAPIVVGTNKTWYVDGFDCLHRSEAYKGLLEFKKTSFEATKAANKLCVEGQESPVPAAAPAVKRKT